MPFITMNERRINAGRREFGSNFQAPVGVDWIKLTLTSSEWATKTGTVFWGFERSMDNGTTWEIAGGSMFIIGQLNKGTLMPTISLSNISAYPTAFWRMFIEPSISIRMGMEGEYG